MPFSPVSHLSVLCAQRCPRAASERTCAVAESEVLVVTEVIVAVARHVRSSTVPPPEDLQRCSRSTIAPNYAALA